MRDKCAKFMKFSLPVLFIVYMGVVASFTHVHIINGVTIVHSHPYDKNPTEHQHTGTELQLLHQLSTIQQAGSCSFDYVVQSFYSYETTLNTQPVFHNPICILNKAIQLRAPPALV